MAPRDPYGAFERLVAPGRGHAQIWRLFLGLGMVMLAGFGVTATVLGLVQVMPGRWPAEGATPASGLLLLFLAGGTGLGAIVAAVFLHHRRALDLLGPAGPAWAQFRRVLVSVLLLNIVVSVLLPGAGGPPVEPGLDPRLWIALLPLTVLALIVQTGAEELVFRGYLQSQIAARGLAPLWWMGLPSALFALLHFAPGVYGADAALIVIWAFLFGLVAADLTARAGTLGPAIALHFVNNLFAVAIVAMEGPLSGLALYVLPVEPGAPGVVAAHLPVALSMLGLGWLAARVAIRA